MPNFLERINSAISFILLGILIITFTSCKEQESAELIKIPGEFEKMEFSLDSIATDMLFIRFSNKVSLPGSQLVKWYDPYFYYPLMTLKRAEIHRFTSEGKYVDKLSKNGRGPDEYLGIMDYFVDERTGNLYVITNRIVVFDKHFNYLRDIKYPVSNSGPVFAQWLNNNIHLFFFSYTGKGFDWVKMDTSGNVLNSKKCTEVIKKPNFSNDFQIFRNNSELFRFYNRNDTIFRMDDSGYYPYRLLTREFYDGYNMINEEWTEVFQFDGLRSNKPYRDIKTIIGIGDKWIIHYRKTDPSRRYREEETVLYYPYSNTSYLINTAGAKFGESVSYGIKNDWVGSGTLVPSMKIVFNGDEYIAYVMEAYKFKSYVNRPEFEEGKPKRPALKKQMKTIANDLKIDDNPVLIMLKLK